MQFSNELLRKQCVKSKDEGQEIVCFSVTADNLLTVDSLQLPNDAQKTERYLERDAEGVCCVCMCVHTHTHTHTLRLVEISAQEQYGLREEGQETASQGPQEKGAKVEAVLEHNFHNRHRITWILGN